MNYLPIALFFTFFISIIGHAQNNNSLLNEDFSGKPPILKQCKNETSPEELKKCLSRNINKLIQSKINFKKIESELKPSINYFYIDFLITKNKKVEDILMNFPEGNLSDFLIKTLKKLKFQKAGTLSDGTPVNVKYTVPLTLKNDEYLNKPTPVYGNSKLEMKNIDLEELSWAPRYYFEETNLKGKIDQDKKAKFESTKKRFISTIYNHINIYKIGGYLKDGMNVLPIDFTIAADGTLTNLIAKTDSEHLNDYLETTIQSLPKISIYREGYKNMHIDFHLELAFSLKMKN